MGVTLKDFEVRYQKILEQNPKAKHCSVKGCKNPVDFTGIGEDTCCAYHRLLFDYWAYEVDPAMRDFEGFQKRITNQRARRSAFTRWRNKIGKVECDRIVLHMACEPINWEC